MSIAAILVYTQATDMQIIGGNAASATGPSKQGTIIQADLPCVYLLTARVTLVLHRRYSMGRIFGPRTC